MKQQAQTYSSMQGIRALDIMDELGLSEEIIAAARESGHIPHFLNGKYFGNTPLSEEAVKRITEYEQRTGSLVYAVSSDYLYGYHFMSLLFVSKYEEDWLCDISSNGDVHRVYAYVYNLDYDELSETGSVFLESINGSIKRIG